MGIDIGVIKDLYKAVLIRHDIVHRNGKDKDGKEHVITKEDVEKLCAQVNDFIYNIECKLPATAISVEDISSPFDVRLQRPRNTASRWQIQILNNSQFTIHNSQLKLESCFLC